ncbi:hypothetical protein ACH429_03990 [Streptomyces pathocidini]|uniref:Uncharacterized protein n=1 Tax=Streptomyces pathocidini TaxID=1650571 RepID=A0ABW7UKV4_9ACTN|nr:hypothetical protein [Streptomyces pathocidini]
MLRSSRVKAAAIAVSALAVGSVFNAIPAAAADEVSIVSADDITTLGGSTKFAAGIDSEFRYDGVIRVPSGMQITDLYFEDDGDGLVDQRVTIVNGHEDMTTGDTGRIVSRTEDGAYDLITFSIQGDLGGGKNDNRFAGLESTGGHGIGIKVVLVDEQQVRQEVTKADALSVTAYNWETAGDKARPLTRLPYDTKWGGTPNSAAGFGYITEDGKVPGDLYILHALNQRIGKNTGVCDVTDEAYYQFVREDGTPSSLTPNPVKVDVTGMGNNNGDYDKYAQATRLDDLQFPEADKGGYYKFLVWPQAKNSDGTACNQTWEAGKVDQAFQVGSVFYDYVPEVEEPVDVPLVAPAIALGAGLAAAGGGFLIRRNRNRAEA